ncbi:MAG: hypothetical protein JO057_01945 [Chloroflexi bacterium]|nr:hypothetical protein [Chloroflexota bacterium]
MPVNNSPRLTQSGACAACGAYGGTQHPDCHPRTGPRLQLGHMRGAQRDARNSTVVREKLRIDSGLVRDL